MIDRALIHQTEKSLAALKEFASKSNNEQLLDHIERLEKPSGTIAVTGHIITVGDISSSTTVAIGRDINIIVNQSLPPKENKT